MEPNSLAEYRTKQLIVEEVRKYLSNNAFTDRKVTDTPTDSLQVVNRRFVTQNGSIAGRPPSSVATLGQFFLATDLATPTPMWYTAAGWRNGVGSIVAQNN